MYKAIFFVAGLFICCFSFAQNTHLTLKLNAKEKRFTIARNEEQNFKIKIEKDRYYNISAEQNGIDIVLYIKDKYQKIIKEQDSPNGKYGFEKITFSPDSSDTYFIAVKPLAEKENEARGNYTIRISTIPKDQEKYSAGQLKADFDILKNAYIETNLGLWYNSYAEFDSISKIQRQKITDKMTALDFYKIVAPLTSFTKEGHSVIRISNETNDYFLQYGTYFPFFVKILDKNVYALNDFGGLKTKGQVISKINNIDVDDILKTFTQIEPADGYNYTSKYKWIETSFSKYLLRFYGQPKSFTIEFADPDTHHKSVKSVSALNFKEFSKLSSAFREENPELFFTQPASLKIDVSNNYALLTINDFSAQLYNGRSQGFKKYLDSAFQEINGKKIKNLIIDLRKNEGGSQGMEDILLSYLITKNYKKYEYVEIPSFQFTFLPYSDYKNEEDILKKELSEEFYKDRDGRYVNKKGYYEGLPPSPVHFAGDTYILVSGLTFSGGSEFAALAKNHTDAIFVGEETGGGYYGNTSGSFINFTLPNTKLTGRIPLCKFVLSTKNNSIPLGRGLTPDYEVQPTIQDIVNHTDAELSFTKQLIKNQHGPSIGQ